MLLALRALLWGTSSRTASLTAAQADAGLVATGRVKVVAALSAAQTDATVSASGIVGTPAWLTRTAANATIRYTLDGSAPNQLSTPYTAPLAVSRPISCQSSTVKSPLKTFLPALYLAYSPVARDRVPPTAPPTRPA